MHAKVYYPRSRFANYRRCNIDVMTEERSQENGLQYKGSEELLNDLHSAVCLLTDVVNHLNDQLQVATNKIRTLEENCKCNMRTR